MTFEGVNDAITYKNRILRYFLHRDIIMNYNIEQKTASFSTICAVQERISGKRKGDEFNHDIKGMRTCVGLDK